MNHLFHHPRRLPSQAFITCIAIFSICLSFFQPATAVQAAASLNPVEGLEMTSISLAPNGPDAPDWPPVFTKKFSPNPIYVYEVSTLTFTIVNEVWMDLTGAAFTDPLPPGVQVAADPAASSTCLNVRFNPAPGDTILYFSGTLPGRGTCTVQVNVTSAVPGEHFNITSELTTDTGLIGAPATDTLIVLPRNPSLQLTKEVSSSQTGPWTSYLEVPAGTEVYYRLTVVNTGDVDLVNVRVSDPDVDLTGCPLSTPFTLTLANPSASCIVGPVTALEGLFTNTATARGEYKDKTVESSSSAQVLGKVVVRKADLQVTKTDGVDQVSAGGVTTYTVRVTNNGPDPVTGATLVDSAGIGLIPTAVACSAASGNQCVTDPLLTDLTGTGVVLPTLTPGQFYEIRLTVNITATSGTVTNTATVTPPPGIIDPNLENNTASDTDTIIPAILAADLEVTKTDGVDILLTGELTTYTVRVTNLGPATVIGANLYDTTDSGLTLIDVNCSTIAGNTCVEKPDLQLLMTDGITLPTLAQGQFYEIKLLARAADFACITTNSAIVTPPIDIPDPNPNNNTAEDTDEVIPPPQANLQVTKTDGVTIVTSNSVTTYTVRVTNIGPDPVTGASLIDSAGAGLSLLGVTCSTAAGNQCVTAPLLADLTGSGAILPLLNAGQFYEILLTARVTALSGSVINTTTVSPPAGTTDPNSGNNFASDTDTVVAAGTLTSNLAVTKTDGTTTVATGSNTTYTIRVTNNGSATVTGAVLVDSLGQGMTPVSVTCSTTADNLCTTNPLLSDLTSTGITLPTLAVGQFYEIRLTVTITAVSGSVTNTATITPPATITDTNPGDNSTSDTNTVSTVVPSDLSVTKTDGVELVSSGATTIYTVRVTNNGSATATGVKLVDSAVTGLVLDSVACSPAGGNTCVTPPLLADLTGAGVTLPTLAPGQFYEILLTATVTATSGSVTNIATITPPAGSTDSNLENNTASDTDRLALYILYLPFASNTPTEMILSWDSLLGYEDLSLVTGQNDYDYNDWAVSLNGELTYTSPYSNLLTSFSMTFTPRTRGGTYDHTFQIRIPAQTFNTNGDVVINLYDQNHQPILRVVKSFNYTIDNVFTIFPKTSDVFPGSIVNTIEGKAKVNAQRYADITFNFYNPVPFSFDITNWHPHGQNLFFDPTLYVINNGEEIHRGDTRLLSIPISTWLWPEEGIRIDQAYPLVGYTPGSPPDFTFPASWWNTYNHCVYDGVACGTP